MLCYAIYQRRRSRKRGIESGDVSRLLDMQSVGVMEDLQYLGRGRRAADNQALRPAAEKGHARPMISDATSQSIEIGVESEEKVPASLRIGLVLSGGGFRATLFHLGVIRFLRDQRLLSHIQHVCSVSGGSIMAAHLVANWSDYVSTNPKNFERAAANLLAFIRLDIRDLVLRRYLCHLLSYYWMIAGIIFWWLGIIVWLSSFVPWSQRHHWVTLCIWAIIGLIALFLVQFRKWSRVSVLQSYYDSKLYGGTSINKLGQSEETGINPPGIDLLATSLTTGRMCYFDREGFHWTEFDQERQEDVEHSVTSGLLPVALAVAASSAFPVVFPPVRVDRRILGMPSGSFASQYLTDGGVYDNLGVTRIKSVATGAGGAFDFIVVSDAEGIFNRQQRMRFWYLTERTKRTSDILMNRVSKLEYEGLKNEDGAYVICRLEQVLERGEEPLSEHDEAYYRAVDPAIQRKLKAVRTDLNNFNDSEVIYLVGHGYAVARNAWTRINDGGCLTDEAKRSPWKPEPETKPDPEALEPLRKAEL